MPTEGNATTNIRVTDATLHVDGIGDIYIEPADLTRDRIEDELQWGRNEDELPWGRTIDVDRVYTGEIHAATYSVFDSYRDCIKRVVDEIINQVEDQLDVTVDRDKISELFGEQFA